MGLGIPVESPLLGVNLGLVDAEGQRQRFTGTPLGRGGSM